MGRTTRKSRLAVTLALLLVIGATISASAAVYDYFYSNSAATVRAPDVTLAAGTDASGSCSVYPCATVSVPGTSDTATVAFSIFKADATYSPPPSTYYTNLVQVRDSANTHSILGVTVTSVSATSSSDFGKVTVYYCTVQCTFDAGGSLLTGTIAGSYTMTSAAGGTVVGTTQSITAGSTQYIEVVAYAGSGATTGDTISFRVAIQWA